MNTKETIKMAFEKVYGDDSSYKLLFLGKRGSHFHCLITRSFDTLVDFYVSDTGIFNAQASNDSSLLSNKYEMKKYLEFYEELDHHL